MSASAAVPSNSPNSVLVANLQQQRDELDVLTAIYDTDLVVTHSLEEMTNTLVASLNYQETTCAFFVQLAHRLQFHCEFPANYPLHERPRCTLRWNQQLTNGSASSSSSSSSSYTNSNAIDDDLHLLPPPSDPWLSDSITEMYDSIVFDAESPDSEAITYRYITYIQEHACEQERMRVEEWKKKRKKEKETEAAQRAAIEAAAAEAAEEKMRNMQLESHTSTSTYDEEGDVLASPPSSSTCPPIYTSTPITDRKSTFQAHCATVHTVEDTRAVLTQLLSHNKIARATHNMWAYVTIDPVSGVVRRDNDDDGESEAGSRLSHLLAMMSCQNVMVVVSRWYGGIQLGADRFRHINQVARKAIEEHAALRSNDGSLSASTSSAASLSSSSSHAKGKQQQKSKVNSNHR